ncbi:MAG TPA: methyltransferase domain-containing protein [Oceanospirillaceae bacterium]|nr:methyltransferase domain-containing protein [Oceanospirillaceae bacterium]
MLKHNSLQSFAFEERQFRLWAASTQGSAFLTQEQLQLAQIMPKAFGHYSVYLGLNACLSAQLESPIKCAIALTSSPYQGCHALMDPHQLPLANDAIDLVIMQHVLDISDNPHGVLREASRIVQAGGRLVVTGFNPYGVWGLWRWLRLRGGVPWRANFLAQSRVKDWLTLLNFGDFDSKPVYDCSPSKMRIQTWLPWLIQPLSAGYVLCAVKQETRVHLLKTHWARRSVKAKFGLAGATQQNGHTHQKTTGDK